MRPREYHEVRGITGWLVRTFIRDRDQVSNPNVRARYGNLGGWVSVTLNSFLALGKGFLGLMIGSQALIADAMHSASDMFTSVIVIIGFHWAKRPADEEHPFGHANAELVASLVMSVLLIIAGFELGRMYSTDLIQGKTHEVLANWWVVLAVTLTIVLKEWLFNFARGLSAAIESSALDADAWHHRLDSITTVIVVIGLIANMQGLVWLDSAIGAVVSLFIMYSGASIAKDSISPLLGKMVDQETLQEIRELALQDKQVGNVHDIRVHKYGESLYITLHMEVLGSLTPVQMHDLAAEAGGRISARFPGDCNIHVDPVEFDAPRYQAVAKVLHEVVDHRREIIDFHDLQFRESEGKAQVYWEFSVDPKVPDSQYPSLKEEITATIQPALGELNLHFSLEPGFAIIRR